MGDARIFSPSPSLTLPLSTLAGLRNRGSFGPSGERQALLGLAFGAIA